MLIYFLIGVGVAMTSWIASAYTRRLAWRVQAVSVPDTERRFHEKPVPQLGGLGIGVVLIVGFFLAFFFGLLGQSLSFLQIVGFCVAVLLFMIHGYLDDRYHYPAYKLVWLPFIAAVLVAMTGTLIRVVTNPFGVVPWSIASVPFAFFLTVVWLLIVTGATKFADGIDGLVTGQAIIGSFAMAALTMTPAFFQPAMTFLCVITGAAYLGFLPINMPPAKQYLGEAGSTIAGFALGFLSIASGAKLATALMVLGWPLADIAFVMANRLWRGQSPFHGDRTHLHHRLLDAGLSPRSVVFVLWGVSLLFGIAALFFHTIGKLVLLFCVAALALAMPNLIRRFSKIRGTV